MIWTKELSEVSPQKQRVMKLWPQKISWPKWANRMKEEVLRSIFRQKQLNPEEEMISKRLQKVVSFVSQNPQRQKSYTYSSFIGRLTFLPVLPRKVG